MFEDNFSGTLLCGHQRGREYFCPAQGQAFHNCSILSDVSHTCTSQLRFYTAVF